MCFPLLSISLALLILYDCVCVCGLVDAVWWCTEQEEEDVD